MKRSLAILALLLFAVPCHALNLISSMTWTEAGDYKMPRQNQVPFVGGALCSTCTTSRIWDGTTIKLFGAKGELVTWVTYLIASTNTATNVMVKISSFTGTGAAAGTGFSSVQVSSTNVWDYTGRPYSLYKYEYVQQIGMSLVDTAWDPTEYDEQQVPPRWQVPCTVNGNNQCSANDPQGTGTAVFTNRKDANKFYPDQAVPIEEFAASSFTVSASSSQAIGGEVYISTGLTPGATYQATLTVYEGATVSTTIPVALYVYNVTLPPTASIPVLGYIYLSDTAGRLTGNRFPNSYWDEPYFTNTLRIGAFLHRHKVTLIGNEHTQGQNYPSPAWQKFLDGSAYTGTYGLAWNTGPGYAVADSTFVVGPYGGWVGVNWSTAPTGGTDDLCRNANAFVASLSSYSAVGYLYTPDDENPTAKDQTIAHNVNTVAGCANNGRRLLFTQTGDLNAIHTSEPDINAVWSTAWLGASSTTWQTNETLYHNSSTHSVAGYNSGVGVDSVLNIQEEGLGSREPLWGAWKTGQSLWFLWSIEYWNDANHAGQTQNGYNANAQGENNLNVLTKDFGVDNYPSTDTFRGHTGNQWTAGDGNLIYPAFDTVYANPNYGFNGVIGSWRLNQLTRGIQDVDIIKAAYAVNPSLATSLVNQQVQDVMYLRQCFTLADCSYSYGPRPWNETLNSWETTRESLLQTASAATAPVNTHNRRGTSRTKGTARML